jgi:Zn-dependent protease
VLCLRLFLILASSYLYQRTQIHEYFFFLLMSKGCLFSFSCFIFSSIFCLCVHSMVVAIFLFFLSRFRWFLYRIRHFEIYGRFVTQICLAMLHELKVCFYWARCFSAPLKSHKEKQAYRRNSETSGSSYVIRSAEGFVSSRKLWFLILFFPDFSSRVVL